MLRVEGMECPELRDQKDPYVFYPKRSYTFEGDMTGKIEIKFCVYKGQAFNLKSIKFNGNKDAGVKFATESIELNQGETQLFKLTSRQLVNFLSLLRMSCGSRVVECRRVSGFRLVPSSSDGQATDRCRNRNAWW